jgi:hypothetical protein
MATLDSVSPAPAALQLMPGFEAVDQLWHGTNPAFASENAARWAIRRHRDALIEAEALALLVGRTYVHRERLIKIIRDQALDAYRQRHAASKA